MKQSKYNILGKAKILDGYFIYNSFTGKYLYIDDNNQFFHIRTALNSNDFNELTSDMRDKLEKMGCIIESTRNEYSEFSYRKMQSRYSYNSDTSFTILPTTGCNFSCVYCYENPKNIKYMDVDTANAVIKYIANDISSQSGNSKHLSVCWYGGEPLLNISMIEYLTDELNQFCDWNEMSYSSSMVSNGYLLDQVTENQIKDLKIEHVQITLDGAEKTHNSRRQLKCGKGTFKKIIENIKKITEYSSVAVNLRVNIDKSNVDDLELLIGHLEKEGVLNGVSISVAPVVCATEYSGAYCDENSDIFTRPDFGLTMSTKQIELADKRVMFQTLPRPLKSGSFCRTEAIRSGNVIDPSGVLFGCWHDVSFPDRQIGTINDGKKQTACYLQKYAMQNPIDNSECKNCKALPLCGGGCPSVTAETGRLACHDWKYDETMVNLVESTYIKKMEKKDANC